MCKLRPSLAQRLCKADLQKRFAANILEPTTDPAWAPAQAVAEWRPRLLGDQRCTGSFSHLVLLDSHQALTASGPDEVQQNLVKEGG